MLRLGLGLGLIAADASGPPPMFAPTDIAWAGSHTVAEDAELGTAVGGALSAVDPDLQAVTFTLTDDADGRFGIGADGTSIIVTGVLDFETEPSPAITVRATDADGLTYDEQFVITVSDVSESQPEDPPPDDGDVIVDDPTGYDNPPYVVVVDGGIKFAGKKKQNGSLGKFIYDIGAFQAGFRYTMRYDADWSLLENDGVTAMVGFGMKQGNDFHLTGLKGDGSTGLDAFIVHGTNWTSTSHTTSNEGDAVNGTQGGSNWLQIEFSADGTTYTLRTSADGVDWDDEITDETATPFADTGDATTGGIAVMLDAGDAGHFSVLIDLWIEASQVPATFGGAGSHMQNGALSDGDLGVAPAAAFVGGAFSGAYKSSGKHYFEVTVTDFGVNGDNFGIAAEDAQVGSVMGAVLSQGLHAFGTLNNGGAVWLCGHNYSGANVGTYSVGDEGCFAVDLDNWKIWVRRNNGNWNNDAGADPAAGTGGIDISMWRATRVAPYACFVSTSFGNGAKYTYNFGASAFAQAVPSGFAAGWIGEAEDAVGHGGASQITTAVRGGGMVPQKGGLLVAGVLGTLDAARVPISDFKNSGKFYFECWARDINGGSAFGVMTDDATAANIITNGTNGSYLYLTSGQIWSNDANTTKSLGARADGDIIGIAVDLDNNKVWFRVCPSGNWQGEVIGSQNPATNTGGASISNYSAKTLGPMVSNGSGVTGQDYQVNFGQAAFSGTPPSGFTSGWTAGAAEPTVVYRGGFTGTSGSVYIGEAAADCLVVAAITHNRTAGATGRTLVSGSIGGTNGTINAALDANAGSGSGAAIVSRAVTAGGSCAIAVTLDDSSGTTVAVDVFTIYGLSSTTPVDSDAQHANSASATIDTQSGGVLIVGACSASGSGITLTGVNIDGNLQPSGSLAVAVGSMQSTLTETGRSLTTASTAGDEVVVAASWR